MRWQIATSRACMATKCASLWIALVCADLWPLISTDSSMTR